MHPPKSRVRQQIPANVDDQKRDQASSAAPQLQAHKQTVTVQSWEGELAEVGLGMASGGSGGYVIYLEWMGKSTSALPTGIC